MRAKGRALMHKEVSDPPPAISTSNSEKSRVSSRVRLDPIPSYWCCPHYVGIILRIMVGQKVKRYIE